MLQACWAGSSEAFLFLILTNSPAYLVENYLPDVAYNLVGGLCKQINPTDLESVPQCCSRGNSSFCG